MNRDIFLAHTTILQDNKSDMNPNIISRGNLLKLKSLRRAAHAERCSVQAKAAKARLIQKGKSRNGRSMNQPLIEAHFGIY